jgi:transposase
MPRPRRPYSAEFRHRLVELVRSGQAPEELARQFEPSANTIRNWVVQAARDEGRRYVREHNTDPRPFIWTASASFITRKIQPCTEASETGH